MRRQDLRRRDGRGRSEVRSTSRRLVAAVGTDLMDAGVETWHNWGWGMFHRVAVLSAAPVATFLTLLLQLLLSFGVGETEAELNVVVLNKIAVIFADDALCDLTSLEPAILRWYEG